MLVDVDLPVLPYPIPNRTELLISDVGTYEEDDDEEFEDDERDGGDDDTPRPA
jgi:hypothetical protein